MNERTRGRRFFDGLAVLTLVIFALYCGLITVGTILIPYLEK